MMDWQYSIVIVGSDFSNEEGSVHLETGEQWRGEDKFRNLYIVVYQRISNLR